MRARALSGPLRRAPSGAESAGGLCTALHLGRGRRGLSHLAPARALHLGRHRAHPPLALVLR
eukprot:3649724-Prymnesium_polylepis.1